MASIHFLVNCCNSSVIVLLSSVRESHCCDGSLMQADENRNRMWAFIFLYVLGLNVYQATGQENSTQMYYTTLVVDETAIENLTSWLTPLENDNKRVDDLNMTTICEYLSDNKSCTCQPGYKWNEAVCESKEKCCGSNTCILPKDSTHMCVSNTRVNMNGSISLKDTEYKGCLSERTSEEYQTCNNGLLQQMKAVFSTLRGFDTIIITEYRVGSIIADFVITIAYTVEPNDLINKTLILTSATHNSTLRLKTTGLITLKMPENPVPYNSSGNVTCTAEHLDIQPTWNLKRNGKTEDITNGTESQLTAEGTKSSIQLSKITELWAGEYTCVYNQKSESYSIAHIASDVMIVALLPNIDISTSPAFPLCNRDSPNLQTLRVKCEIGESSEPYEIEWKKESIPAELSKRSRQSGSDGTIIYEAQINFFCTDPGVPQLTCTFTNRRNQNRSASINVTIIKDEKYCKAEGEWENTKAGFTAVIKCKNAAGRKQRKCTDKSEWGDVVSGCVDKGLNEVLEKAYTVDIGIGKLLENSADVFSKLQNITNETTVINSFANINASVHVLYSLSQKLNNSKLDNKSAVDDLLKSSSNLLEKPLKKSWEDTSKNYTVAERFLSSFEHLIHISDVDISSQKTNLVVNTNCSNCPNCSNNFQCQNVVFNVTVDLEGSDPGKVKTAAFKELEQYLPNKDANYTPNSIVMSTTIEKSKSHQVKIKITFPLLQPRPRNIQIKCVSWNFKIGDWSDEGCTWDGPSNEGGCSCNHLSSFAILMSKRPLEVPGLTEVTYVGLSISVVSLIISIVIELITWSAVVRTNSLYLRHTAHVNISLCLLVADCCFLASSRPRDISLLWCETFVVLKHFCYLSMFFWMLCLSSTLLHQAVFLFHSVSKKNYLRFSLVLGYVCPFLIVFITFLANNGAEGSYFSHDTCWLIYSGLLKGSIHTFLIPVGMIVFINVFSMLVVIMKLLDHPKNAEKSCEKEKKAALTVMRSVILLTPVFGVTWIFGFAVIYFDLTHGNVAFVANYAFTLLNAFQGLFILLTTCLGDKLTRDALLHRLKFKTLSSTNDSTTKTDSTVKK